MCFQEWKVFTMPKVIMWMLKKIIYFCGDVTRFWLNSVFYNFIKAEEDANFMCFTTHYSVANICREVLGSRMNSDMC